MSILVKKEFKIMHNKLIHDFNNYLYAQKALTEMSSQLLAENNLAELKNSLSLMKQQQVDQIELLMDRLKSAAVND